MPMSPLPLALRLGLAAGLAAAPISAQQTVALHPKALRNWDLVLPAPAQREVAGGIAVAHGGTFAAQTEGELLRADLDGDGVMEAQVEGETGFLTLRSAGADGAEYRYSVRLERRPMQPWTWTTGGGMAGELDGTPILFLDQNLDGDYADFGEDAMVIGQDHAASFLSRVISVNGSLFTIELAADGSTLQYAPFEGPSGTLDLLESFAAKAKLDAAVVVNADATLSFSLARARGGLVVPAGEYRLHSGRLALGDSSAVIGAGASKPILVAAGQPCARSSRCSAAATRSRSRRGTSGSTGRSARSTRTSCRSANPRCSPSRSASPANRWSTRASRAIAEASASHRSP
jgi:hypothetical protein